MEFMELLVKQTRVWRAADELVEPNREALM